MEPAQRVRLCRILEKIRRQGQFSQRLRITDVSAFEKSSEKEKAYDK